MNATPPAWRRWRLACAVAAASAVVNAGVLAWTGIQHGEDTARYLASARDMLAGRSFHGGGGWLYVGYNGLIAVCEAAGLGDAGVVAVQFAAAALAALAVFDLGRELRGTAAGLIGAALLVADLDIARWHVYVLTDSLYISLVVLTTWAAYRAVGRGVMAYAGAAAVALFAALVRPNGWLLVPIVAISWIVRSTMRRTRKYAAYAAVVLTCVAGAVEIATLQLGDDRKSASASPEAPTAGEPERIPFAQIVFTNFRVSPMQMLARVARELAHTRRRFSPQHNAAVIAMIAVIYPLAVLGFARDANTALARLIAAVVGGHLILVALTFFDLDGRYLLYVFPLILVLAGCGAVALRRGRAFDLSFRDA